MKSTATAAVTTPPRTNGYTLIDPNSVSLDPPRVAGAVAEVAAPVVEGFAPSSSRAEPDCSWGGGRGEVRSGVSGQPPTVERGLEGQVVARICASLALVVRVSDSTLAGAGAGAG